MRTIFFLFLVAIALILQSSFFNLFQIWGVKPDLVLILVVANGFLTGPGEGAFAGFLGGLLQDLISGSYIGLHALTRILSGYLAGLAGNKFYRESTGVMMLITFLITMCAQVLHYILLLYAGVYVSPLYALLRFILFSPLYNALVAPLVFIPFKRSHETGILRQDRY